MFVIKDYDIIEALNFFFFRYKVAKQATRHNE